MLDWNAVRGAELSTDGWEDLREVYLQVPCVDIRRVCLKMLLVEAVVCTRDEAHCLTRRLVEERVDGDGHLGGESDRHRFSFRRRRAEMEVRAFRFTRREEEGKCVRLRDASRNLFSIRREMDDGLDVMPTRPNLASQYRFLYWES